MDQQAYSFLIPYIVSLALSIAVSVYAWRHRGVAGARAYAWCVLFQASWTLGYIFELASPDLQAKVLWDNVQYAGALFAPMALLSFAFAYTGYGPAHLGRLWRFLSTVSLLLLGLAFADDVHGWLRPAAWLVEGEPFAALVYDFGPLAWAVSAFSYGIYLWTVLLLARKLLDAPALYRAQIGTILVGTLIPVIGTAATLAGLTPTIHRDTTPFTFAVGNLVISWGLFRYRLFDLVPVARDQVIENMRDAVIVLDGQGRVADANRAALELLSARSPARSSGFSRSPPENAIGQPIAEVFSHWPALVERVQGLDEKTLEVSAEVAHGEQHYDLLLSPLYARDGHRVGHLLTVRDTTERVRVQAELEQYRDQLEELVWERTRALTETNKQLRQEVAVRAQAEESLSQYAERLNTLQEIDRDILAARSPANIAQAAVDRVRQLVPCLRVGVTLFDLQANDGLVLVGDIDLETESAQDSRFSLAPFGDDIKALQSGQIVWAGDLDKKGPLWERHHDAGIRAYITVPLLVRGELIGSLNLGVGDAAPLLPEQTEVLQQVANHLAIAIQQADLREQVERHARDLEQRVTDRTRELSVLYEVASLASQPLDLETILARALDWMLEAVGAEMGAIHLLDEASPLSPHDPGSGTLRLQVEQGLAPSYAQELVSLPVGGGLVGWVVDRDEPVIVPDVTADSRALDAFAVEPRAYVGVPLRAGGRALGVLSMLQAVGEAPLSVEELSLLTSVADQLGTVVESVRLQEQAEKAAVLEERGRLARELHDSVTQLLYGINLFARAGRDAYSQGKIQEGGVHLDRLGETASQAIKEMRLLLYELRPRALTQQGLIGALQHRLDAVEGRAGVTTQLLADPSLDLPAQLEQELYHIAQEALNNALKHSAATSVQVRIQAGAGGLLLEVTDNGTGFDPQRVPDSGGMGLANMRDRAEQLGAHLALLSAPGEGTTVRVRLPSNSADAVTAERTHRGSTG